MIHLKKKQPRYISLQDKLKLLQYISQKKNFQEWEIKYRANQMQELRDFLMIQLKNYKENILQQPFEEKKVKEKMIPIQTYYQSMDCREPLDACFSETCLGSNPACFSNKMKGQIEVILNELYSAMEEKK